KPIANTCLVVAEGFLKHNRQQIFSQIVGHIRLLSILVIGSWSLCPRRQKICSSLPWTEKGPSLHFRLGQVKQSRATLKVRPSPLGTRRAEHFWLTSIVNSSWRVIFWTTPAATFGDLFICAKICSLKPSQISAAAWVLSPSTP